MEEKKSNGIVNKADRTTLKPLITKILFGFYLILLVGIVAYSLLFMIMLSI